jgi:hypothetical protein
MEAHQWAFFEVILDGIIGWEVLLWSIIVEIFFSSTINIQNQNQHEYEANDIYFLTDIFNIYREFLSVEG